MAPQVNATHRCLHEQLVAVEAARGTLVLDVQNVRDHVRSRAARPETRPSAQGVCTPKRNLFGVHTGGYSLAGAA